MNFNGAEFQFSLPDDRIATVEFGVPLVAGDEKIPPPWKVIIWENGTQIHTDHGSCTGFRIHESVARLLLKQVLLTAGTAP